MNVALTLSGRCDYQDEQNSNIVNSIDYYISNKAKLDNVLNFKNV